MDFDYVPLIVKIAIFLEMLLEKLEILSQLSFRDLRFTHDLNFNVEI